MPFTRMRKRLKKRVSARNSPCAAGDAGSSVPSSSVARTTGPFLIIRRCCIEVRPEVAGKWTVRSRVQCLIVSGQIDCLRRACLSRFPQRVLTLESWVQNHCLESVVERKGGRSQRYAYTVSYAQRTVDRHLYAVIDIAPPVTAK